MLEDKDTWSSLNNIIVTGSPGPFFMKRHLRKAGAFLLLSPFILLPSTCYSVTGSACSSAITSAYSSVSGIAMYRV